MMGKKKLGEIRSELKREIEKRGEKVRKALDRLMEKTRRKPGAREGEIEALRMIRGALERKSQAARKRSRRVEPRG